MRKLARTMLDHYEFRDGYTICRSCRSKTKGNVTAHFNDCLVPEVATLLAHRAVLREALEHVAVAFVPCHKPHGNRCWCCQVYAALSSGEGRTTDQEEKIQGS